MTEEIRRTHFPYCLQKQDDGTWIILNRNYKPIGFTTHEWVDYDNLPIRLKIKITPKRASLLSCNTNIENHIWLYNDGCIPTATAKNMQRYLQRLALLAKIVSK